MSTGVRQSLMASKIGGVYCTNGAYGVIATQGPVYGAVIVWGATLAMEDAGEIPPELAPYLDHDVIELYSIKRFPYVTFPPPLLHALLPSTPLSPQGVATAVIHFGEVTWSINAMYQNPGPRESLCRSRSF
ncbi:hypothetical protein PYV50_12750 [Pseudomonas sp. H22_DOA]|nr:hypothetical protein PYV50_12750 [Pseudomonas sp. H22_DOA]